MNDLALIQQKIYEIRQQKVMLDRDLAALYGVETRVLNQAVQRNISRFPEDFMFQLSTDEFASLKSQIVTSKIVDNEPNTILKSQIVISSWGGARKRPYAFTELGVAMLSSVLRSETAIDINIKIMRAFVELRRLTQLAATSYQELKREIDDVKDYIEEILRDQNDINEEHGAQLEAISQVLAELQAKPQPKPRRRIGFNADDEPNE